MGENSPFWTLQPYERDQTYKMVGKIVFWEFKDARLLYDQKRDAPCLQTLLICTAKETFRHFVQKRNGQRRSFLLIAIQGVRLKYEPPIKNFRRSRMFGFRGVFK